MSTQRWVGPNNNAVFQIFIAQQMGGLNFAEIDHIHGLE
jgi:hypothetical protein